MAPISWHLSTVVFNYGPFSSLALCFFLAVVYVGSLYIWTSGNKRRDHHDTIRQRFFRITVVCSLMFPFLWLMSTNSHSVRARNVFVWVGVKPTGFIMATIFPLLLTMLLFMGPLYLHYLDGIFKLYKDVNYWKSNFKNLIWVRNHIVVPIAEEFYFRASMLPLLAPALGEDTAVYVCPFFFGLVSEEFMFRACMLPLLVPGFGESWAVFLCPLSFGVAHFHHLNEKLRGGDDFKQAIAQSLFQFVYTTVFGAYSAFLFLRTGHVMAPVIAHAFCNHMGFPNFQEVLAYKPPTRHHIIVAFGLGLLLWYVALYPLTEPWLYGNDLYYQPL